MAPKTRLATASDHTSPGPRLVDARTAMAILGVRAQTLYAYVSRGRIARIIDPLTGKSLFSEAALAALVTRRDRDRQPAGAVRGALDFGLPILDSRISSIRDGRLLYRDRDALTLAEHATLEQVAAVLWGATTLPDVAPETLGAASASPAGFLDAFGLWLAQQMQCGQSGTRLPNAELIAHSTRILRVAAIISSGLPRWQGPIHESLSIGWGLTTGGSDLLRRTLALLADPELNNSTFVVRCVASTLANPYAAILAGCCALRGQRHGNVTDSEDLLAAAALATNVDAFVASKLAEGHIPAAFGHAAYPAGDPRAAALLDLLQYCEQGRLASAVARAVTRRIGSKPRIDFALAALVQALGLPRGTGRTVFALARLVGWLAHAMEQYGSPVLIRPRAGRPDQAKT